MYILRHKITKVVSPYTATEYAALKKQPHLLNRFEDITPTKKEPAPPELANLIAKNNNGSKSQRDKGGAQAPPADS